jgi:hypothetical protein
MGGGGRREMTITRDVITHLMEDATLLCAFKGCKNPANMEIAGLHITERQGARQAKVTLKNRRLMASICDKHLQTLMERDWSEWLQEK